MHVAVKEHRSSRPANQLAVISIEPLYPHSVSTGEIIDLTRHGNFSLLKIATSLVTSNTAGTSLELKSVKEIVKVDVLKQIWLFGSVQISGTVYSEVSYSGRSIVGSIGHSDLSNSL
ncbi:tryptophan aminotransferase-related protein 3 [Dorcoceras hygrometricum]|uniref:Tryptophan aminotransferase-related protein 3 n=1 Tax=Dorcoceras hygrometricum TaxID=472368 RepID=A0A2Z7BYD0_9LAMI|nr:tryptophan aminotransferase-related protein 3 [Dorcoceras hygrometricum]